MKDIFKKIVREIDLRDFAPELETEIQVWVNPPRSLLMENAGLDEAVRSIRSELEVMAAAAEPGKEPDEATRERGRELARRLEEIGNAQAGIFAQLWSQGSDPESRWTAEEIQALITRCLETDPALWGWLRGRTFRMITEYRAGQKKV